MGLLDVHANFPYLAIASSIGLEPIANYSVAVNCPYCGSRSFAIYQDNANLEELYFCSNCHANGSVIGLACEQLGLEEAETLKHLASVLNKQVAHDAINDYCKACELKNKYIKFWKHAKKRGLEPSQKEVEYLKFLGWNVRNPMSFERLWEGPAELYGTADPKVVEKLLGKRVLKKSPMVVLPFYKMPGVLSSFLCLSPKQTIHTNTLHGTDVKKGEPGFAGMQFLDRFDTEIVIATSLLKVMVQLQLRHFSSNINPLAIVGWNQPAKSTIENQWSVLGDRQVVMWEREPSAAMLHQAMICNASIVFHGPRFNLRTENKSTNSRWKKWVTHEPAIDVWRKLVKNAKPVEQALKNWARVANKEQKIKLFQEAEQYNQNTAQFVRQCLHNVRVPEVARKIRIGSSNKGTHPGHTSTYSILIEKNKKWYDRQGNLKLSGVVRVEKIVVHPSEKKEYIGKLITKEKTVDFRVPKEQASMVWLKKFAFSHGIHLREDLHSEFYNKSSYFRFNPFEAAIEFEQPTLVLGQSKIGWDGDAFQFKEASLKRGVFSKHQTAIFPADSPGPKQRFSAMRKAVEIALNKKTVENEIVWALAIGLCSQVTAPVVGLQPYSIILKKKVIDTFVQTLFSRFKLRRGSYENWDHNWPRRLDNPARAFSKSSSSFFVTTHCPVKKRYADTIEIDLEETLQPRLITYSADKIITNYLRWFSKNLESSACWPQWLHTTKENLKQAFPFLSEDLLEKAFFRLTLR